MKLKRLFILSCLILTTFCFSCSQKISDKHLAFHIIAEGHNLYEVDNNFVFRGETDNNYLSFSNSIWRIIEVFSNGEIRLIQEDGVSNKDYSEISEWLNNNYVNLLDTDYLADTLQYQDQINDINNIEYKERCVDHVSLLDVTTYLNSLLDNETYLDNGDIYWLKNSNEDKAYVAYEKALSLDNKENVNEIRPVITLKKGIEYLSGDGSLNNPYIVKDNKVKNSKSELGYVRLINPVGNNIIKDLVKTYRASMIMTGDALIHGAVYEAYRKGDNSYDFTECFERVKPIVEKYDIAYYNQETVLGGYELGLSGYPQFCSPVEVGEALADCGFNLVSLATNHTLDGKYRYGTKAIENEIAFFSKHPDILTAGVHLSKEEREKVEVKEVNGITYCLLSYTYGTNGISGYKDKEYLVDLFDEELVKRDVSKYRDQCDVLMVAMHWGEEYNQTTTKKQREQAQFLADLGVDLIIGCHPHVLEPITMVDDTLCIYSLGNFVSAQINHIERLTGALVSVDIVKTVTNNESKISFENVEANLIYTAQNRNYQVFPYSELDDNILPNYQKHFKDFEKVITKYWDGVKVK